MTIELPREVEMELRSMAAEQGVSVGQYLETLVARASLWRRQLAEFRAAISERVASLNAGEGTDGEAVMCRLISGLASR